MRPLFNEEQPHWGCPRLLLWSVEPGENLFVDLPTGRVEVVEVKAPVVVVEESAALSNLQLRDPSDTAYAVV